MWGMWILGSKFSFRGENLSGIVLLVFSVGFLYFGVEGYREENND
jgi:hypothetical protein